MKTEKEILDVLVALKEKLKFEEEHMYEENSNEINNKAIYPDNITDTSAKILALSWVLGIEKDIFQFGKSIKELNLELKILNLLNELVENN